MTSTFPVAIGFDNPDPRDKPADFEILVALLNELIRGEVEGNFVIPIFGAATPSAEDQDKLWYRTDGQGRPIGVYHFYNGAWRREYDHRLGEVVIYTGNPGVDFAGPGHKGTVGGEWDGFQLCSGENGSPNMSNKFIVGGRMDDLATGFPDTFWVSTISGTSEQEGEGTTAITLTLDNPDATPPTTDNVPKPAREAIELGRWDADTNTGIHPPPPGVMEAQYGHHYGRRPEGAELVLIPAEAGITSVTFPTLPPYYAVAYAIFLGYE